ncbi:phytoene/squalene synthase family protein [Paracoccus aestuarii]|uniref:Phytoene/squalene synthase family protein n=1 Tax=Paracoccus aestuarii TaxID=453842 RepID=A0A418ZVE0_9RHOB|nr:phytoene/squalene synthase family protein [Paracoccus aestuarii]RJL02401.1 phytoene/squalene synthase family protein [Paracoccus aestuarii]WCR00334.1 phytoene/squalene synthase family protein [Paracoccus aestuarii]
MSDLVLTSQQAITQGSQSFATAARLMPPGIREDTVMLYAWCRHADDVIDGQALGSRPELVDDPQARLEDLRAETLAALNGPGPHAPPFAALRQVALRHDFPPEWPLDLIQGFAMDVEDRRYRSIGDVLDYSYHVAGVVGVMMARVMGVRDDRVLDHACDLGLAFQLTNIARDVMDDARIGRCYLPADWLEEAGATVEGDIPSPELYAVILRLLDTAEPYYASARQGLPALPPRCAWSIAAALRIYRAIGGRIRRGGPEAYRSRISTSRATKMGLLAAGGWDVARTRIARPAVDRAGLWTRPRH